MNGPISIDFESVLASMRLIIAERDGVPAPAELRQTDGTSIGVTAPFHGEVVKAASTLALVVETIRNELEATHEAIRKTVEDMVAKDQSLADDADTILAVLESTVSTPAASTPSSPPAPSSSSAPAGPSTSWQ